MKLPTLSHRLVLLASLSMLPLLNAQNSTSITLETIRDTTIYSQAENSNGQGSYIFVGETQGEEERRALLAFDLSEIPSDAAILEASLSLYMNKTVVGGVNIHLHRLIRDWGEGPSDAPGQEGMGAPAEEGDSTWLQSIYPDTPWEVAGGEFISQPSATAIVGGTGYDEWSGDGLITDVQGWIDRPNTNYGWILVGETGVTTTKRFDSRHSSNPDRRPTLTVTYTAGPPLLWAGYQIEPDGRSVNTGDWLGWIDVGTPPWVYSYTLNKFIYLPEDEITDLGAWSYLPK